MQKIARWPFDSPPCGLSVAWVLALFGAPSAALGEDNAVIRGKVFFEGNEKDYTRVALNANAQCNAMCPKGIGSWNVILNKTEPITVRNVMISIHDGLGDRKYDPPKESAVLEQKCCEYVPHVLGLMAGQELLIRNADDTAHNIHFLPKVNDVFNKSQVKKDIEDIVTLQAEEPFHVKCDVHPWMGAYIGVFKHPFFSVTDKEGTFELKGLPPGKYVVKDWHEKFGEQLAEVEIKAGETREQSFTYEPDKQK